MRFPRSRQLCCCAGLALSIAGCEHEAKKSAPEALTPATTAGVLRISEETQRRLGLAVQSAARREVASTLTTTGWLESAPGRELAIRSPVVGFVVEGSERKLPRLGDQIERGERLVSLHVFLTPQEIAQLVSAKEDVDIAIEQSRVSMRLAQEQLERLAAAKDAVAGTRLAELREVYERSKAAFNESRDKLPFLIKEPYDGLALARPVPLEAPIEGKITRAHVAPGEFVTQGDMLWTISDWSTLWLRVPVFEGDLGRIDREAPATIALPGTLQSASALPIKAPQPTRPNLRTTDLLYEVSNADLALRSGQSFSIDLPTGAAAEQVVVPRSALLWDGLGNAWVYVRASSDSFRRQKVEIGRLVGDQVVIARGLSEDEQVVTVAAASLYGEEFKTEMPAEDDD